jgi:hypothetical protein
MVLQLQPSKKITACPRYFGPVYTNKYASQECLKQFLAEDQKIVKHQCNTARLFVSWPFVKVLLALKDCLYIPDDHWQNLQSNFNLGHEHCSIKLKL